MGERVKRYIFVGYDGDRQALLDELERHADEIMKWLVAHGENGMVSMGPEQDLEEDPEEDEG